MKMKKKISPPRRLSREEEDEWGRPMVTFKVNNIPFVIDAYYVPLKVVGCGAYGIVISATDTRTKVKVAIKKITSAFEDTVDAKRVLREIKLLNHFHHENVIKLYDLIPPKNKNSFEDVYIVFHYMETDMHKIIYSKNKLGDEHCKYFIYQILCGLKYVNSAKVIHRDLKPSNLLLNENCDLKICDLGLARGVSSEQDYELTEYVVTRWYRAPEIMCSCQEYDEKIDVWATGCIMAEVLNRTPVFPGENYIHQLNLIFEKLGKPTKEDMQWVTNPKAYDYIIKSEYNAPKPFRKLFPTASALAIDLLQKMLNWNPNRRISVDKALRHPYFSSVYSKADLTTCPKEFNFNFEKEAQTDEGIRSLMFKEVSNFKRPQKPDKSMQFEEDVEEDLI